MNKNIVFAITLVIAVVLGAGSGYYIVKSAGQKAAEPSAEEVSDEQVNKMVKLFAALDAENVANREEEEPEGEDAPLTEYKHFVEADYNNIVARCDSLTFADQQMCYKKAVRDYMMALQKNGDAVQFGNPQFPREFLAHLKYIINDPSTEFGSCAHKYRDQKITDKVFALCIIDIHYRVEMNIRAYQNNIWHDGL